jgi:chromosome segregation ATPase
MAREGITYEDVVEAADSLLEAYRKDPKTAKAPTVASVRAKLGRGSISTVSKHMRRWRDRHRPEVKLFEAGLPDTIVKAVVAAHEAIKADAAKTIQLMRDELNNGLKDAEQRVSEAHQQARYLGTENKRLEKENGIFKEQLTKTSQDLDKAEKGLVKIKAENEAFMDRLIGAKEQLAQVTDQLERVQQELKNARAEAKQAHQAHAEQLQQVQDDLKSKTQEHLNSQGDLKAARAEITHLTTERAGLQGERQALTDQLTKQTARAQAAEAEKSVLVRDRDALDTRCNALSEQLLEKERALATQAERIRQTAEDLAGCQAELTDTQTALATLREEHAVLKAQKTPRK